MIRVSGYNSLSTADLSDCSTHFDNGYPRLSGMSSTTKHSICLNQIHKVEIKNSYLSSFGVQLYCMDVYLNEYQKGIPTEVNGKTQQLKETDSNRVMYQLLYRFAEFYQLRKDIAEAMKQLPVETHCTHTCPYCKSVWWLVLHAPIPSRSIFDYLVNKSTFLQKQRSRHREKGLTVFMKWLLVSTKDSSYRYGNDPCEGYAMVSIVVNNFLLYSRLHRIDNRRP